ncbi:hypothetical protein U1Q18_030141 [Sarracenia purpurea var. burkii]
MAKFAPFLRLFPALVIALTALNVPVSAQTQVPCSASTVSSFTPCMNFITNSSGTGSPPTAGCCNSLRTVVSNGTDCLCMILTGNVPFQIPINRTLALSLPRACKMSGVPLQCKASAAPIPAPGSIALSPTFSSLTPQASAVPKPASPALAPEADTTPELGAPSSTVASEAPTTNSGIRPVVTQSAAAAETSLSFSPPLLLAVLATIVLKLY